jgi:hypothetical protein
MINILLITNPIFTKFGLFLIYLIRKSKFCISFIVFIVVKYLYKIKFIKKYIIY